MRRLLALLVLLFGCGSTPWPDPVTTPAAGAGVDRHPDDFAVIVAIERYEHLPSIRGAESNARDWSRYFRDVRGLPPDRVRLALDDRATREGILSALLEAVERTADGGRVWFVFIGHGTTRADADPTGLREGLLVAFDARRSARSIEGNSVSQARLARLLAHREHVVLLDACFSGSDRRRRPLVPDLGLQLVDLRAVPSGVVLTATAPEESAALLSKGLRPAFSYAALGALRGWCEGRHGTPADGQVTAPEVARCAGEIIRTVNRDTHTPQVVATGAGRTLDLARGVPGGFDLDGLLRGVHDAGRPGSAGPPILFAVGGLGIAAGVTGHILNYRTKLELQRYSETDGRGAFNRLRPELDDSYTLTVTGYTVGGLALAAGLTWSALQWGDDEAWLALTPDRRGIMWGGRF